MSYEVVLFDADGTLFDFARAESYALEYTFREMALAFEGDVLDAYRRVNHAAWREFETGRITSTELRTMRFERFCAERGIDADATRMSSLYLSYLARAAFLIDGAKNVVERLRESCRLVVVTNGLEDVQISRFERSSISEYFEAIVISEAVGSQKPDPAIFGHALERLGHLDRSRVLMVGDSLSSDIQGGINFGIDTCWYNPAGAPTPAQPLPRYVIRKLEELMPLCLSMSGE